MPIRLWGVMMVGMKVVLLVVPDCPNDAVAMAHLRSAVSELGMPDMAIRTHVIDSISAASRNRFIGSPTITVDGIDLFPAPDQTVGLTCRIYRTPEGLAGAPTTQQLKMAIANLSPSEGLTTT